jgi:hypothetical protein
MFLTTECVIADKKEDTPAAPAMNPGMGGMGGMMYSSFLNRYKNLFFQKEQVFLFFIDMN